MEKPNDCFSEMQLNHSRFKSCIGFDQFPLQCDDYGEEFVARSRTNNMASWNDTVEKTIKCTKKMFTAKELEGIK